jgi:hypothetical protein
LVVDNGDEFGNYVLGEPFFRRNCKLDFVLS